MLHLSPIIDGYIMTVTVLLGCVIGSFLNCMAWRLVHGEPITKGRSHCTFCGHPLGMMDLIPVFSWIFLRGKCRYCGKKISPRYMISELLCGVLYGTIVWRYDVSMEALRMLWLLSLLLAASLVDWEDGWIPDRFLIAGVVGGIPLGFLSGGVSLLREGIVGAAALFFPMMGLIFLAERLMKTEAMGGGDLKLIALLGFYFGWQKGLLLLFLSSVIGLMMAYGRGKKASIPFGPALALAAWMTALWGDLFLEWYMQFLW